MLGGWLGGRKGGLKGMWLLCGLRMVWTEGLEPARMPDKQSTLLAAPPPIGPPRPLPSSHNAAVPHLHSQVPPGLCARQHPLGRQPR